MAAAAVALTLLAAGTSGTRAAWTEAALDGTGSTATGTLSFAHAYQSTTCSLTSPTTGDQACSGSIAPTTGASGAGVSYSDVITNNGTLTSARLSSEVRAAEACGPVQLANRMGLNVNPLLPRYGTTFHTSGGPMDSAGYVDLDGGSPGGYATSVVAATQPGGGVLSAGTLSGVGVWFKAAPGTTGPLFSFGASPANGSGSVDRALYLDGAGKLRLVWNTGGSAIGPSSSSYADNAWHFAYVTFGGVNVVLVGLIPQVTLWVDGVQQATTPLLSLSPMSSYSGYWHLGWAPTSVTGLGTAYLGASLSNFVVINSGSIPSGSTLGMPSTQTAFNTAVGTPTQHWLLNDSGTTTFSGTPPATMATPCSKVTIGWAFTNPAATVATAQTLTSFADNVWRTVAAPAPGTSQTSTITLKRGAGYSTDLSGLHLYAPLSYRVQSVPAGSTWSQTFTWASAASAFIA